MFGKIGDMMGKLQEMKQKAEEVKAALERMTFAAEAAGGDVRVTMNGTRKVTAIHIAPAIQHGDAATLERALIDALGKAAEQAEKFSAEEMKKAAGGLLPGL